MSYKKKIIILFIITSFVPLFTLQLYLIGHYSVKQRHKITALVRRNLEQKKNLLKNELADYQQTLLSIMTNKDFTDNLNTILKTPGSDHSLLNNRQINILSRHSYMKKDLIGFAYYENDTDTLFGYNKQSISNTVFLESIGDLSAILQIIDGRDGAMTYIDSFPMENMTHTETPTIVIGSHFYDLNRIERRGYMFILLSTEGVRELLNPLEKNEMIIFSETFLLHNGKLITGVEIPSSTRKRLRLDQRYLRDEVDLGKLEWTIATIYNEQDLFGEFLMLKIVLLGLAALSVVFHFYMMRNYILRITNTLGIMRESMKIENNELRYSVRTDDDLEYLNLSFDNMKEKIDALLKDQTEKTNRIIRAQEERRIAEIKALEAQINPHFLYNTLNSLNWIAIDKEDQIMSEALTSLAGILRYSISGIDATASLSEEIQWLKQYLKLQQIRFDDLFDYTIDWDESLGEFRLYKLLLQPFVENTLIHGFEDIRYKGKISVKIEPASREEGILITIKDNGIGFDSHKAVRSTGITNPISRLQAYYGSRGRISVRSEPGEGTEIKLSIPEAEN